MSRETTVKTYLNKVKHNYDYVLIDCMPSLVMMSISIIFNPINDWLFDRNRNAISIEIAVFYDEILISYCKTFFCFDALKNITLYSDALVYSE